ncbi:MAG: TnsA endonuclease N-terminal domain-containing protein [Halothiobacillaceae bacterium]
MSVKMKRAVWWESQLERDYCYILEHDRDVISYRSQPITISYSFEDTVLEHTPDFEIIRRSLDLPQYAEIKPDEKAIKDEFILRHRARSAYFYERGHEYILRTGSQLREGHRLKNIKLLYRYAQTTLDPALLDRLRHSIPAQSMLSLDELITKCSSLGNDRSICYGLMYHGEIAFDLDQPIQPDMRVTTAWSVPETLL